MTIDNRLAYSLAHTILRPLAQIDIIAIRIVC